MTVGHINVKDTIEKIKNEISKDKSLSPILVSSIELLILVIQILSDRLKLNSTNSSLSPSGDKLKRPRGKDKNKRKKKSEKKVGGQDGHTGATLEQYEEVDEVVELSIDRRTLPSNIIFQTGEVETRQIIDINLEFTVTEYRAEVLIGSDGSRYVATFPSHITKAIQYGPSVKSLAVYMSQYQLVPYARVQEVFKDQFGLPISQGTLCNFNKEAYDLLTPFESHLIESLNKAPVLNADETGIQVDKDLAWVHVLCTPELTFYYPHEKRGKDAMIAGGIIPKYMGTLVHDHWKPYLGYGCRHALCNAHHLRELQWVTDFVKQKWAKRMKKFLLNLNDEVNSCGGVLSLDVQKKRLVRYREIIKDAKMECPIYLPAEGSGKKKVKQTKERNLLERLSSFEDQVLLFMTDIDVPFTNNQAERDIRMIKVQQKISGHFKSINGAKYFCRIRSFLMTFKKLGHSPFDKLIQLFDPEENELAE